MGITQTPKATNAAATLPGLEATEQALLASWTPDTSDDPDAWNPDNPAAGQCVATTLVLQALYGGEIVVSDVRYADGTTRDRGHAWNRLPSGEEIDFTYAQFRRGEQLGPAAVWSGDMDGDRDRVAVLAERVGQVLGIEIDVSDVLPTRG